MRIQVSIGQCIHWGHLKVLAFLTKRNSKDCASMSTSSNVPNKLLYALRWSLTWWVFSKFHCGPCFYGLTKTLLLYVMHFFSQTSLLKSGARITSWIIPPWRQQRPLDQSWLTLWTGSSFPSLSPALEPRATHTTSKELWWPGSSCRYFRKSILRNSPPVIHQYLRLLHPFL